MLKVYLFEALFNLSWPYAPEINMGHDAGPQETFLWLEVWVRMSTTMVGRRQKIKKTLAKTS